MNMVPVTPEEARRQIENYREIAKRTMQEHADTLKQIEQTNDEDYKTILRRMADHQLKGATDINNECDALIKKHGL
jgi:hypothetical protein